MIFDAKNFVHFAQVLAPLQLKIIVTAVEIGNFFSIKYHPKGEPEASISCVTEGSK